MQGRKRSNDAERVARRLLDRARWLESSRIIRMLVLAYRLGRLHGRKRTR